MNSFEGYFDGECCICDQTCNEHSGWKCPICCKIFCDDHNNEDFICQHENACWRCCEEISDRRYGGFCEECGKKVCTDCSTRCDSCWLRWCNEHCHPFKRDLYNYPHCKKCQK